MSDLQIETQQEELKVMLEEEDGLEIFLEEYEDDVVEISNITK